MCTGLRCSELGALQWWDFDWQKLTVQVRRGIVNGHVDRVKTEYSQACLPLAPKLVEALRQWRLRSEYIADSDFVVASPFSQGEKPYALWGMQRQHLRPAAIATGVGPIGWHCFRHTYRAWLADHNEPITVQKDLMRHACIRSTLNIYGGALMEAMRAAHEWVVEEAFGEWSPNGRQDFKEVV